MYDKEKKREINKRYYQNHKEEILKRGKNWRENNPERVKETNKKYRKNNLEKVKKSNKKSRENNPEKAKERSKKYRENNPEKVKEKSKKYRENNSEKIKKSNKKWREKNTEKMRKNSKKWRENNKEKIKRYNQRPEVRKKANSHRRKKRENPLQKLSESISRGVYISLKSNNLSKNKKHYENFIIDTFQEIKEHLEKNFLPGMTLKNHGRGGWHVHHIVPIEFFKFTSTDDIEFKYCWSTDNLTPLWGKDNVKKGDKVILWGKEYNARNLDKDYFSKITY